MILFRNIYVCVLIVFVGSCTLQNTNIDKEFLIGHEWMIDTMYGQNDFIQEWIYFTADDEFYRFSKYNKSYIIDSACIWNGNMIWKDGEERFSIEMIDSNYILLKGEQFIFRAKKWRKSDPGFIEMFIQNNKSKLLLNGEWRLDSIEIGDNAILPICGNSRQGAVFNFSEDANLFIRHESSLDSCRSYFYQVYDHELSIQDFDVIYSYPISKITSKQLILEPEWSRMKIKKIKGGFDLSKNSFKIYFRKIDKNIDNRNEVE